MAYLPLNTLPFNSYIFLNLTRVRDKINSLCQLPRSGWSVDRAALGATATYPA